MKKWRKDSDDASALRVTLAVALLFAVAVLFAFPFAGSPIAQSGVEGLGEGTQKLTRGNDPLTPPPPSCTDNTWRDTNIASAPPARSGHTAVWTGTEMIVWGGSVWSGYSNTGARYNPVTDSWTPTSTSGAPNSRESHVAVWTGSEMIVWGGRSGSNTGKRYNPQTDTWTTMSTLNAPSPRYNFAAVWTGTEMIVWGGENGTGCCPEGCCAINTGGRYNPVTDAWTPTDALTAPPARAGFPAVWTGTEMIVWGGGGGGISGGRYNPVTNSWTPTSTENAPAHQILPTAVWTGSEMIVWGGATGTSIGGRYNPATDTWVQTSAVNAPIGRYLHTAIWDGEEMIVWGGFLPPNVFMTGGRYNPVNDTWTATATTAAPIGRIYHSAVWTGHEMIVWGGGEDAKIPPTPTSAPDPLQNKPVLRRSATTTTSASDSVIDQPLGIILSNTGGRYCATGLPTATPTPPLPGPTVSLPIDTISNQVPVDTVLLKPITTTNINPSLQYLGFQADFTFDEGVITFASPFVEPAGLTGSNWNVSGHIIPGTGPVRILRVSAFSNDFTPMNGSGVLYNLRMVRVSGEPQRSTPLSWRPFPDNFYFIDEKFNKNVVAQIDGFITIIGTGPTATPTPPPPTPTPSLTPTPTPTLTPVPTVCGTFSNSSPIAIPASGSNGIASPYPSNITVSGLGGTITRVAVAINGINHAFPKDIDVLLVGPGGQNAIIMSDVGGYAPVSNINLVLEDAAYRPLPNGGPLISGSFRPTNILDCVEPETDPFPMPAPTPSGASAALSIFNGTNPNGTWRLYVLDDSGLNQGGNFSEGWAITLETGNCGGPTPTPTPTIGPPRFSISVPGSVVQGIPFNFTVTANNIPNYTGTVHFTSSDSGANLPGDSTLSGGTGTFQATINNGVWFHDQTITATDTSDLSITGTSNCIFINKQTPCPGCGTPTPTPSPNCSPSIEGFNNVATLPPSWYMQNNSQPGPGTTNWFQGNSDAFPAQGGAATSYIGANFNNGTGTSTLSNWLLTPPVSLRNGVVLTFWTRTVDTPAFPDRLQVRMSTNGSSANVGTTATSVGDFTNLLLDINPTYTTTGYPNIWTQFSVTVSGIPSPTLGRLAFRYFVENGGPNGTNSDYIGIDTLSLDGLPCPCATPSFSNSAPITIPGSGTSGIAAPYPSTITVTGVASPIRKVEVTLRGLNHTSPRDIDILLVGPHGQNAIIMSDAGSYHPVAADLFLMDYSEDPAPPMFPPYPMPNGGPMFSGNYLPTNYVSCEEGAADIFPAPAPIPSGAVSLSTFNAADPNGTWSLYVVDDKEGGAGSFSGGWDLKIYPASCPQATPIGTCCPSPPPTHFQIIAPASVNPGVPFSFTVTADGQVGTIHFTSSDPLAVLPNDSGLVGGTGTFSATLNQISSLETITATDIGNFHSTGISNCIATGSSTPTPSPTPTPCTPVGIQERFDDIATLVSRGWFMQNNSQPGPGTTGWFQGDSRVFPSFYSFPKTSYLAADFNNGTGTSTLSNWLLTPPLTLENGLLMTFWMKTVLTPSFPDRLQVRLSTNGASTNVGTSATDVGDFSRLLLDTNPPIAWTPFTVTVTGLASSTTGRLALRYFVENGGPSGSNSDYIGIDQMQIAGPCPPTPTPTAKPTPTSSPPPPVSIDPGWGPFGSKIVGSSSPSIQFKVFVTRPQTVSVSLSDTTNFSITEDTCSSASGNPCFVAVKFNPYTAGPKVASLTVNDTYGTAIVSLTGTGRPLTATPAPTPSGTPSPTPTPARALNLSTRLRVETGNNVGVGGFIITGTAPRQVLLRGIGPSLVGVGQPLADPVLELHGPNGFVTVTNNNWRDNQETEIIATGIPPTNDLESAILATLDPGAYTAILSGNENGTGTGLVEIYDLSQGTDSNLANISTRAFVSTGSDIVIAGFILGGGTNDDRILVRGIGPSLTGAGVPNALVNPTLELRNGEGALVAANDDWQNGPPVSLPPSDSSESAIELTLSPGAYTALLFGVNNGTGVGLVEVFDLGLP